MGKWHDESKRIKPYLMKGAQTLPDTEALEVKGIYPTWKKLVEQSATEKKGFKFTHGDKLYKTMRPEYTFVAQYEPGTTGTESMFAVVDETHAGTLIDPIPYEGNMELVAGLYYSQNGVVYLCIRSTGQPVYHALADLVGLYVETVKE